MDSLLTQVSFSVQSDLVEGRRKAVQIIQMSRNKLMKRPKARVLKGLRKFQVPPLDWDAEVWWEMINWDNVTVAEPELLRRIFLVEFEKVEFSPMSFPMFSCHSQTVERCVKLVTEASSKVCGQENRHKRILTVMANRAARKPFESKNQYQYSDLTE